MKYTHIFLIFLLCFGAMWAQRSDKKPDSPSLAEMNKQAGETLRKILIDHINELESAKNEEKLLMLFIIARVKYEKTAVEKTAYYGVINGVIQANDPYAAFNKDLYGDEVIAEFVKYAKSPDLKIYGLTPIMIATIKSDTRSMDILLQNGADPFICFNADEFEKHKKNPLAKNLLSSAYNYLLKTEASINNSSGSIAVKLLANPTEFCRAMRHNSAFSLAQAAFAGIDLINSYKQKEQNLLDACRTAAFNDIENLLDGGINPNIIDQWGNTPLLILVKYAAGKKNYKECVELLMARDAHTYNPNTSLDSPISCAVENATNLAAIDPVHDEVLNLFIKDVTIHNEALPVFFITASDLAKRKVLNQPVKDVNLHPDKLQPALYYAVLQKKTEFVSRLLEMGANANILDTKGRPLLSFARENATEEIVNLLLKFAAREK